MISGLGAINPTNFMGGAGAIGGPATGLSTGAAAAPTMSFASMVARTVGETVGSLKQAEQLSLDALQGKTDMRAVVDAVMSAEQSLQAAVAIRDKIITAYLEVSRMSI